MESAWTHRDGLQQFRRVPRPDPNSNGHSDPNPHTDRVSNSDGHADLYGPAH